MAVFGRRLVLLPFLSVIVVAEAAPEDPSLSGNRPRLIVEESTVHYPVQGRNRAELLQSLRVPDPVNTWQAHGLTRSYFRVDSELVQSSRTCVVHDLTIRLKVRIDLPEWSDGQPIPKGLQTDWQEIVTRAASHEGRHRQYALDAANDLHEALLQQQTYARCKELAKIIRQHTSRVRVRWQLRDSLLDQRDLLRLSARRKRAY